VATGSDDVLRVVQTLLAAQVITRNDGTFDNRKAAPLAAATPRSTPAVPAPAPAPKRA
jgi:hypothetical protein